ncbi:MAG TPA: hypothetical protein VLN73_03935, partial [Alphaproteobacteria bacterium]|nr:hypothetical protein [Alphaproteobacteria bacterium]
MRKILPIIVSTILGAALIMSASVAVAADDVSDFFKKTRVKVIIGFSPGGGYDRGGRVVARHLYKYIPGNPSMIAQNMPGAGSLRL